MNTTAIAKWGNSYAVRIPKALIERGQFREGESLEPDLTEDGSIMLRRKAQQLSLEDMVAAITPQNRPSESDWGIPTGREVW